MPETTTDEQELAKALDSVAGLGGDTTTGSNTQRDNVHDDGLAPIVPSDSPVAPTPAPISPPVDTTQPNDDGSAQTTNTEEATPADTTTTAATTPTDDTGTDTTAPAPSGPLDSIKNEALNELRPLVDKLGVAPEEKFDTYLLLIRSSDDMSLIAPAHEAAKAIPDESRRAQALLDIIKEIDYLTHQQKSSQ